MSEDKQILVVEDEAPIRMLWERFLTRWGYAVDLAENGQEALDHARAHRYRLVVTDLTMPVLGGHELIYTLKQEQPELEIIVTTGHGTIEIAVELMKAGAYDFITKPISFKHAELVIKKCLEQVEARQENVRLRQVNQELEELNKIKEKFIAITSHELRTPVSIISSLVEILEPELRHEEAGSMFKMISRSSERLNEIVAQMHELSALNASDLALQRSEFDLAGMCREIAEELYLVVDKRRHTVSWDVPEGLPVTGDRVKLKKVVRELFQNAVKFTEDQGHITVAARRDNGNALTLTVQDDGIGIAEEEWGKIFHLFYEVGESLHHHTSGWDFLGGGMGVGLSVVKEIVEAHGGQVTVNSRPGEGSTFTVTIPQHEPVVAV